MTNERDGRAEIHELVCSYCRAMDRMDLEGCERRTHGRASTTTPASTAPPNEYVTWLARRLPALDGTMHVVGNHLVEVRGDEVVAETYSQAVHWGTPAEEPALNFTTGSRYVDHLVREDGAWRIRSAGPSGSGPVRRPGRSWQPVPPTPRPPVRAPPATAPTRSTWRSSD